MTATELLQPLNPTEEKKSWVFMLSDSNDSVISIPLETEIVENKEHYKLSYFEISKETTSSNTSIIPRILLLLGLAIISLGGVIALVRTIPGLFLPTTLETVKRQAIILEEYSNGSWKGCFHIIGVLSVIYIWKQAFSVPGAIFLNLLAGALYGTIKATILTSLLTSIGASFAYYLGKYAGKPLIDQYFSEKLNYLRKQVDDNRHNLFFYLLFIRMFPLSPWWVLNLVSPLLLIPISSFFTSMFFGSIPYNLACSQAGNLLSELQSTADIWQPILLLKMILVSLLSLIPPLVSKKLKKRLETKSKQGVIA